MLGFDSIQSSTTFWACNWGSMRSCKFPSHSAGMPSVVDKQANWFAVVQCLLVFERTTPQQLFIGGRSFPAWLEHLCGGKHNEFGQSASRVDTSRIAS